MTHILFADDNPDTRDLVTLIFSTRYTDVTVSTFEDGTMLMNHLHTTSQRPDLILFDYQMPPAGNGGLWVAKQIAPRWPGLPLFCLSAYSPTMQIKAELAASGTWGYLEKNCIVYREVSDALAQLDWAGLRHRPGDILLFNENVVSARRV